MADAGGPIGDEVDLKPNGTVTITLAGKGYRWRRPLFGELRKFEELWAEIAEKERAIVERANEIPEKNRTASWRINFEMEIREAVIGWALDVWRVLCDKEPPAVDELPAWVANTTFHQSLKEHWTTVPLAASSR